jgi:hypothetical protein
MSDHLTSLRNFLRGANFPGVIIEGMIPPDVAAVLRARVAPALQPFYIADRGRYACDEAFDEPEVFAVLAEMASAIAETELRPARRRWVRMGHGDYAMHKDDHALWRGRPWPYELVLDFSEGSSQEGQIVYSNQDSSFVVPQQRLVGALINRRGSVIRYDRYLTCRIGAAEVYRLSVALVAV